MAGLKVKMETEVELKASADTFYSIFSSQAHQVPNATPDIIQGVQVHEGDWKTHGSVKLWKYTVEGNAEVFKEKVELDDASRTLTPKGDGCLAKLTIESEKLRADVPPPDKYFTMMFKMTKDVDAHLVKA